MALLQVYLDGLLITEKEINIADYDPELATLQTEAAEYQETVDEFSQTISEIVTQVSDLRAVMDSVSQDTTIEPVID